MYCTICLLQTNHPYVAIDWITKVSMQHWSFLASLLCNLFTNGVFQVVPPPFWTWAIPSDKWKIIPSSWQYECKKSNLHGYPSICWIQTCQTKDKKCWLNLVIWAGRFLNHHNKRCIREEDYESNNRVWAKQIVVNRYVGRVLLKILLHVSLFISEFIILKICSVITTA